MCSPPTHTRLSCLTPIQINRQNCNSPHDPSYTNSLILDSYRRSHKKWKGIYLRGPTSVGWGDQFCTADWNYSRQQLHRVGHTVGELWSQCFVEPLHLLQLCYSFDLLLVHSAAPHHSLKFGSVQMQSLSAKITFTWDCGSIPSAVWPTHVSLHHQVQTSSGT